MAPLPGVVAPPKTMSRFVTKPSVPKPALAMPKVAGPKVPKAGRLTPTGGRAPGAPAATAPRIPKPVVPGLTRKSLLQVAEVSRKQVLSTPRRKVLGKPSYKRVKGHYMPVGGDFLKSDVAKARRRRRMPPAVAPTPVVRKPRRYNTVSMDDLMENG